MSFEILGKVNGKALESIIIFADKENAVWHLENSIKPFFNYNQYFVRETKTKATYKKSEENSRKFLTKLLISADMLNWENLTVVPETNTEFKLLLDGTTIEDLDTIGEISVEDDKLHTSVTINEKSNVPELFAKVVDLFSTKVLEGIDLVEVESVEESKEKTKKPTSVAEAIKTKQDKDKKAKQGVKEESKKDVKEKSKKEVKEEPKQEVKEEPKQEVKEEPKQEVKEEPKQEVKEEPKQEVKEEPKQEVKEEPKQEVKEEPKQEVKEENNHVIELLENTFVNKGTKTLNVEKAMEDFSGFMDENDNELKVEDLVKDIKKGSLNLGDLELSDKYDLKETKKEDLKESSDEMSDDDLDDFLNELEDF